MDNEGNKIELRKPSDSELEQLPNNSNQMKKEYWDVTDEQVVEKTGKKISEWIKILDGFKAEEKKSTEVVVYLQEKFNVPRYWARTLTTLHLKKD
jgi:hypothetical protein